VRIFQTLLNLAGNAVKFTDKGAVTVILRCVPSGEDRVVLEFGVQDTGIGIAADKLESLFEAFHQVDASSTRTYGGTGLGLSISRRIATLLGGDIRVRSQAGVGSLFTLSFPCDKPPGTPMTEEKRADARPTRTTRPPSSPRLSGRILVVEDVPENQMLIRTCLEGSGATVTVADHGGQAIERCRQASYDLILVDIQMPVMNGIETLRELRRRGIITPAVALAAHAMKGDRERYLEAGFEAYLSKPFNKDHLIRLSANLLKAEPSQVREQRPGTPSAGEAFSTRGARASSSRSGAQGLAEGRRKKKDKAAILWRWDGTSSGSVLPRRGRVCPLL